MNGAIRDNIERTLNKRFSNVTNVVIVPNSQKRLKLHYSPLNPDDSEDSDNLSKGVITLDGKQLTLNNKVLTAESLSTS